MFTRFSTKFSSTCLSTELLYEWKNAIPNPNLLLPSKNHFIPTDFSIKTNKLNITKYLYPVTIYENNFSKLWYTIKFD